MLFDLLETIRAEDHREAIRTASLATPWCELKRQYRKLVDDLSSLQGQRVAFAFPSSAQGIAALAAFERLNVNLFLVDNQTSTCQLNEWVSQLRLDAVVTADDLGKKLNSSMAADVGQASGCITILTSGTSGRPKAVQHRFESLTRPVRRTGEQGQRWLMAYRPHLYAGLQVMLQALLNHGTLVIPAVDAEPREVVKLMVEASVQYASATPSYWRRLLLLAGAEELGRVPMRQVTLGGEVIDQPILDQLAGCFPQARIVHIYATTEVGRCFSVSDRLAGFPASFLGAASADGVELKIVHGELYVRSANAMAGYDERSESPTNRMTSDGWFKTGDLVEIREQRVYFVGRTTDMINVGGNKVHPVEIEQAIRELSGVAEVRIYAQRSSIAGELVACDVVPSNLDADFDALRQSVVDHCNARLNRYQRPRIVRVLKQLELSDAGKMKR